MVPRESMLAELRCDLRGDSPILFRLDDTVGVTPHQRYQTKQLRKEPTPFLKRATFSGDQRIKQSRSGGGITPGNWAELLQVLPQYPHLKDKTSC